MGTIMTIKEVENELGIPRATVRFYEKNGLINPSRGDNSYRQYSIEDIAELKRIIILRKLGISVDEIGNLLKGETDLTSVLNDNLERLDGQLKELTGAIKMCKRLQEEGTTLDDLSQNTYWDRIEEEEQKGKLFMSIAEDFYIVGKHSFLSQFGIEDCEGNATTDTKGIIKYVLLNCLFCGIFFCILNAIIEKKPLCSLESFKKGFIWPFILVITMFILELPFYYMKKKHPVMAKRLKTGFYAFILIIAVLLIVMGRFGVI